MTARLKRHWPDVAVRVLHEGLRVPTNDERQCLKLPAGVACWVREVLLHAGNKHLIVARTIVPEWTPENPWQIVSTLGQRPLGELLFSLPHLVRTPLEFTRDVDTGAFSRRRVYEWSGARLLLTEEFLLLRN